MRRARWLAWLIAWLAPRDVRSQFVDDLTEAVARHRSVHNPAALAGWFVREAIASLRPLIAMRWAGRAAGAPKESRMTLDSLIQDVRYAVRMLWRSPAFALTAVATIALGVGANAAIFSVVHALILRPLPYPRPAELVTVWQDLRARGGPEREWATPGNLVDWRAERGVFASMASVRGWGTTLTGNGDPEALRGEQVTADYFTVLGVAPALGRGFEPNDAVPGAPRVLVLSDGLWRRRFGADPSVLGRRIALGDGPYEIIGVLPAGFRPAIVTSADLWRPDRLNLANPSRGAVVLRVFARLAPGVSAAQASVAVTPIAARLAEQHPQFNDRVGIAVVPMHEFVTGNVRPGLLAVFGSVLFVLLIACVNVANLLLARASSRAREMAVRSALGATRRRVVRQLLTESVLLASLGGCAGVGVSLLALPALVAIAPAGTPRLSEIRLDLAALAFTATLTVLTGLVFGLIPARQLSKPQLPALKEGARAGAGPAGRRMRRSIVVLEIAVACVLLVGSGLLVRSFLELRRTDLGFDPRNVLVGFVAPPGVKYSTEPHRQTFFDRVLERIAALPGVSIAAATSVLPFNIGDSDMGFVVEGAPAPAARDQEPTTWYRLVSPGYFDAMGIPLRRGRTFEAREAAPVVIVNERLAQTYWPGADPIGRRVRYGGPASPWVTVVGIAGDVKQTGARDPVRLQSFLPYWQLPELAGGLSIVLKTSTPPETLKQPLRQAVRDVDPDIPVTNVASMETIVADAIQEPRFLASVVGLFASLALVIAAVGVYGVLSYSVSERRREIGVRLALGSAPRQIFGLVLGDGLALAAIGIGIGLAGALALAPAVRTLLYGVPSTDPATFGLTAAALASVAVLATLVPARRATRVDAIAALRGD